VPISKSPSTAYLTGTVLFPGSSAQATAAAAQARLDIAAMAPTKTGAVPVITNGVVVTAP
jgi:hypothetical protein